jgi:hypothetical protein
MAQNRIAFFQLRKAEADTVVGGQRSKTVDTIPGRTTHFAREPGSGVLISVLAVEKPLNFIARQTPNHA